MRETMTEPRIRWRNRLAAWLYGVVGDPLMNLAVPVWTEEAERDFQEQYEAECRAAALDDPPPPYGGTDALPF
jgi:hypothetical protein